MSKLQGQGVPTRSTEREAHRPYCVKQRLKWAAERLNGKSNDGSGDSPPTSRNHPLLTLWAADLMQPRHRARSRGAPEPLTASRHNRTANKTPLPAPLTNHPNPLSTPPTTTMTHQNNATLSRKRHHPTHPQPATHTPARPLPATAPSFKDLPRQTRSPLRMTHQTRQPLFFKKAGTLPIHLFSWSAASLATIAALSSYGTPAFAHHFRYPGYESRASILSGTFPHPSRGQIVPTCSEGQIEAADNNIDRGYVHDGFPYWDRHAGIFSIVTTGPLADRPYIELENTFFLRVVRTGYSAATAVYPDAPGGYYFYCHAPEEEDETNPPIQSEPTPEPEPDEENNPPIRTSEPWSITRRVNLDLIRKPQETFNLDKYFTDPDGDSLTYTASSSQDNLRAEVRGNTLYVFTNPQGEKTSILPTEITVTADDGNGGTVSDSFRVLVSAEELSDDRQEIIEDVIVESAILIGKEIATGKAKAKAIEKVGKVVKAAPKVIEAVKKGDSIKDAIKSVIKAANSNSSDSGPVVIPGEAEIVPNSSSSSINKSINNLTEALYLNHDALEKGYISLDQAFSGKDFSVPFNLSQVFSQDQESSPRFNALLNANIGFSRFSDSSDPDLSIDGTTTNYGIGLTVIPNPEVSLVTGLQFGYTRSNSDFEHPDTEGTYDLRMFSVHPFIGWDATDSLTLWSVIGYGRPNDEITIESVNGVEVDPAEDSTFTSSGDFFSFAGGANYRVWQSDLSALSIGLSGSTTSFLDNDSKEGSLSAQFSHKFPFDAGQLKTSADLALILSDSGPSATELSGNLNWLPNQGRLSGSTNARVLLFGGDRSEWGIGGSVTLLPGERGEGLSLALRPSFGQTNTALSNLHLDPFSFSDPTELALSTVPLTARFNAELAYGFPTGNHALLTPYTKLSMGHYGTTTSAGLRYHLDSGLDLDLSASHRQRSSGNNDNRFFLQLRSDL